MGVVKSMSITQAEIETGLIKLGVKSGMILAVHCSLKSFGQVEGGAISVIDAVKNIMGSSGTILMPSFRISPAPPLSETDKKLGITSKIKILRDENEKTAMGVVSDTFRTMPDVVTGEGLFRVSAWGNEAEKHACAEFKYLIASNGYALLLGVDIYAMSAMHYVEDALPVEIKSKFAPSEEARAFYPESEWLIEAWTPCAKIKPWHVIQKRAYEKGYITDITIGNAKCMLVKVKDTVELYRQALKTEAFELYGLMV